jgi:hypothetical protein
MATSFTAPLLKRMPQGKCDKELEERTDNVYVRGRGLNNAIVTDSAKNTL